MDMKERLERYLGHGVDEVRSISNGWETEVYAYWVDGVPTVLRIYQGQNVAIRAETEFRMMQHLGRAGYPVPRVDRFSDDPVHFGGPFLLMEGVEGGSLAGQLRERPEGEVVEQLCRLMVDLHSRDWQPFVGPDGVWPDPVTARGSFDTGWMSHLFRSQDLLEPVQPLLEWIEEQGRSVAFRLSPIHGDFHFDNLLVRPDGSPVVIDWSAAALTDPRWDLACAYILMTTQGQPARGELIRQTYEAMAGAQPDFEYFVTCALIRRLLVMTMAVARGSAAIGLRPGLEGQLRQNIAYPRLVASLVAERTGLNLHGLAACLSQNSPV